MLDNNGKFAITISLGTVAAVALAVIGYYVAKKTVETVGVGVINTLTNPYLNFPKPSFNIPAPTYKSQEANKSTTNDNVKVEVKPILPQAPSVEQTQPCTTATFTPDMTNILRGERLTINESVNYIKTGGNVMCDSQQSAFAVASNFPSFIGPEIDKNQKLGFTYYPHYHPDRYSHRHIWFYPTSN